ncbi:MAG: ribosome-associated translation inhibitor RaiA [Deltaproteobacteria bacterium]|nr:ribosome-associated translation inhibitor RaiA [Deltaproteobacteria bacterium]
MMTEPTFTFRNLDATDGLRVHAQQKLEKIRKYCLKPITTHVILALENFQHCAEITVVDSGLQYIGHAKSNDMYVSIDQAIDKLARQLQRKKEQVKHHHKKPRSAGPPPVL